MKFLCRMGMMLALAICLLPALLRNVSASDVQAAEISSYALVVDSENFNGTGYLFDKRVFEGKTTPTAASLDLHSEEGFGSLYITFDEENTAFTITDTDGDKTVSVEAQPFYHRFVDMTALFGYEPKSIVLRFPGPTSINEIQAFTAGEVPSWVQKWELPAEENADLVLFSTHGDDEQLFFCGILPYYGCELGYQVQVVYLTDHRRQEPNRVHEMLNGLWNVGVHTYPVFGSYPDFVKLHDMQGTYDSYGAMGYSRENMLQFVADNLRRFRPKVAIGHDVDGEYGHGMHMVYADLLMEAVELAADPTVFPESARQYGAWDTPKTYLHLYQENPIVVNWDVPLEKFGGMTAYQVSKELGYPSHVTQYQDFYWYYWEYETAAELPKYSPCNYGLYRTTVGADEAKNDFFEHVTTHAEDAEMQPQQPQQTQQSTEPTQSTPPAQQETAAAETVTPTTQPAAETVVPTAQPTDEAEHILAQLEQQHVRERKLVLIGLAAVAVFLVVGEIVYRKFFC